MSKKNRKNPSLNEPLKHWHDYYIYLFLIAVITFAVFIPSLKNNFTNWDDDIYVTENWKIKSLSFDNVKLIFSTMNEGSYEPLTEFLFAVQYHFAGINPSLYHIANLLLHFSNSLLVFFLIMKLSGKNINVSFLTAVLFGIHPMRVESVAWVSELKDVVFTLFFLISLLAYITYLENKERRYYIYSIIAFILCLLPKSQALTFPFILILADYFFNKKINSKTLTDKIPYFIISFVFFIIMYAGARMTSQIGDETGSSMIRNISYACFGLVFYIVKFFIPVRLSNCYPLPESSGDIFLQIIYYSAPVIVILLTLLVILKRKDKKIVFVALFYLINLLLVLQLKRTNVAPASDRYTYIPYIGMFFLASDGFFKLFESRKDKIIKIILLSMTAVVVLSFSWLTLQRCKVWKDSYTLWTDAIKNYPNTPVAHNQIAVYFGTEKKDYPKAIVHFKEAIRLDPLYFKAYNNLGLLFEEKKEYAKAIECYTMGLKLNRNSHQLYYNIGFAYHKMDKPDLAIENYKKAIASRKTYLGPYNNLARILMYQKKYDEAEYYIKEVLKINPNYIYGYISYADLMAEQGRYKEAFDYFDKAFKIVPGSGIANLELCKVYIKMKDYDRAEKILNALIKTDPKSALPYVQLAVIYSEQKVADKAENFLKIALELEPDNKDALELKEKMKK